MTCIAWDGEMLAGDRQATHGGTPVHYGRKVHRIRRFDDGRIVLFGCAGLTGDCHVYERWAAGKLTEAPKFTELHVLSVDEDRQVWVATENMHWFPVREKYWAIGSGAEYALGAMAAGKNARDAVRIAMRYDNGCGIGVDVVRFR